MLINLPQIGAKILVHDEFRYVVGLPKNEDGDPTVMWKSKNNSGVCVPSVWFDWLRGQRDY